MTWLSRSSLRLLVGILVIAGLTISVGLHQASGATPVAATGLRIVNQTSQSFAIAFQTTSDYTGSSVMYGTTCAATTGTSNELPSDGYSHLVYVPGGLLPNTSYYYKLVINGTVGTCRAAKTLPAQSEPPVPSTIYGMLKTSNCAVGVSRSLVMVSIRKVNGTGSLTYAAITGNNGTFALPFGEVAMSDGSYANPSLGDTISLSAIAPGGKSASAGYSYNGTAQLIGPKALCTTANS